MAKDYGNLTKEELKNLTPEEECELWKFEFDRASLVCECGVRKNPEAVFDKKGDWVCPTCYDKDNKTSVETEVAKKIWKV